MPKIEIVFYTSKLKMWINSLEVVLSTEVYRAIEVLNENGSELGMPVSKALGEGLFELRIRHPENLRVIYTFYKNQAWILHVFKKKTNEITKKDFNIARKRLAMLLA